VAEAAGRGIGPLGLAALALGLCCYGAAFAFIHRQSEGSFDFRFLAWLGVLLVLGSCPVLLPAPLLALAFTALGLLSAGLGRRFQRPSLLAHGAILLAAAALASGWLARARDAFLAPAEAARTGFSWTALLVLAALAAGHLAMSARRAPSGPWQLRLPGFVQGALCLLGLGAMGLLGAAAAAGPLGPGPLAALRTLALAARRRPGLAGLSAPGRNRAQAPAGGRSPGRAADPEPGLHVFRRGAPGGPAAGKVGAGRTRPRAMTQPRRTRPVLSQLKPG